METSFYYTLSYTVLIMFSYRLDAVQFSNFRFAIFVPSKGCLEQIALSDMAARCIGFLVNNYCCIVSKIESTLIQEYKKCL